MVFIVDHDKTSLTTKVEPCKAGQELFKDSAPGVYNLLLLSWFMSGSTSWPAKYVRSSAVFRPDDVVFLNEIMFIPMDIYNSDALGLGVGGTVTLIWKIVLSISSTNIL